MPKVAAKKQTEQTRQIYTALKAAFPSLSDDISQVVYEYLPVAIRVRVVDPAFDGMGSARRESKVMRVLRGLPKDVIGNITMLLTLTPDEEAEGDLLNQEFEDPSSSYF